jgi:hypothetical protein
MLIALASRVALALALGLVAMMTLAEIDPAPQPLLVDPPLHHADFTVCQTIAPPPIAGPHETVKRPYPRRNDTA